MSNQLTEKIIDIIHQEGSISVSHYMQLCLADPDYGYYIHHDPFGAENDFITAPEISPLFAHVLANFTQKISKILQNPQQWMLCELGAGRGSLMRDLQKYLQINHPDIFDSLQFSIVETSPLLREQQKQNIPVLHTHYDDLNSLPSLPIFFIANEFFDALPTNQYVKRNGQFYIRTIEVLDGKLSFGLGKEILPKKYLPTQAALWPENTIFEHSPIRLQYFQQLISHMQQYHGAALLIDYGEIKQGYGDTLQAMKNHKFIDIFSEPGQSDLTTHVDFASLLHHAQQQKIFTQSWLQNEFLYQFNIQDIVETQIKLLHNSEHQAKLMHEYLYLMDPKLMGELFKIICICDYPLNFDKGLHYDQN